MLFYIFRHGETDGNVRNLVQGAGVDLPLNENWRRQAAELRDTFAPLKFPVIYSSHMIRAVETAEFVAEGSNARVVILDGLEEIHFGKAEGMLSDEAKTLYKDLFDIINDASHPEYMDTHLPGGETVRESIARSLKAFDYIKKYHCEDRAAVATHGGLMFNLYQHFFGLRRKFANCDYFVVNL